VVCAWKSGAVSPSCSDMKLTPMKRAYLTRDHTRASVEKDYW
jgi:hypothetical protein